MFVYIVIAESNIQQVFVNYISNTKYNKQIRRIDIPHRTGFVDWW